MIGCDYTYSILRFRGVLYHHLLDSVRFVAADRPHTINLSPVIPVAYPVIPPRLSCHSRAYPVVPAPVTSFSVPSRRFSAPIPSFPLPIPSFLRAHHVIPVAYPIIPPRPSRRSRCVSRHSRAYPVIPPRPSRRSRCHHVMPAPITSFPRRRESCGLFPKRIHRSTCATMNQTERPLLSSLLHCGEAGGHDAVYVDMMLSIEVEVVA